MNESKVLLEVLTSLLVPYDKFRKTTISRIATLGGKYLVAGSEDISTSIANDFVTNYAYMTAFKLKSEFIDQYIDNSLLHNRSKPLIIRLMYIIEMVRSITIIYDRTITENNLHYVSIHLSTNILELILRKRSRSRSTMNKFLYSHLKSATNYNTKAIEEQIYNLLTLNDITNYFHNYRTKPREFSHGRTIQFKVEDSLMWRIGQRVIGYYKFLEIEN